MSDPVETVRQDVSFTSPLAPGITFHRIAIQPAAPDAVRARLLIVHGYGDHAGRYAEFMTWLAGRGGVACHAIDLRGHGRSSGPRVFVRRWDEYLDDLRAALAHIEPDPNATAPVAAPPPLFVLGHSHGGLVVAVAAERQLLRGAAGCILSAPFLANRLPIPCVKLVAATVLNVLWPSCAVRSGVKPRMTSRDPAMIEASRNDPLVIRKATPRWYFEHQRAQAEAAANASRLTLPVLILQGEADPIADPAAVQTFHANVGSLDKTFVTYPGFLHEPLRELGREGVYADVLNWITSRIQKPS